MITFKAEEDEAVQRVLTAALWIAGLTALIWIIIPGVYYIIMGVRP
jgi:hypothetical protein